MLLNAMQGAIRNTFRARIYEHPFNQGLSDGTLSIHHFYHFLEQDKQYLCQFSKSLACVAKRSIHREHRDILMQLSDDEFKSQAKLHDKYLCMNTHLTLFSNKTHLFKHQNDGIKHYIHHIDQMAERAPLPVAIASLIPCFYIYSALGSSMQEKGIARDNPYQLWIESYSNHRFLTSTQLIMQILNELMSTERETIHFNPCMNAFTQSVRFEIGFWDSVYYGIPCVQPHQQTFFDLKGNASHQYISPKNKPADGAFDMSGQRYFHHA